MRKRPRCARIASGMHAGTSMTCPVARSHQAASLRPSHAFPFSMLLTLWYGSPMNPSDVAATSWMCEPHDADVPDWKVWSEIA